MLSIVKEVILNDKKNTKMFPIIHNKSTNQKQNKFKRYYDNQYNITQKVHESANEYKPDISEVSIKNTNDTVINDTNISDTLIVIEESGELGMFNKNNDTNYKRIKYKWYYS